MTALMAAIREFGFQGVILVNEEDIVLAGHGRLEAAKCLKLKTVPTMVVAGLTKAQQKAYVLADNKLSQMSRWDHELLRTEIELLLEDNFQIVFPNDTTKSAFRENSPNQTLISLNRASLWCRFKLKAR